MTGFDIKIFRRWQCFKQGKEENSQELRVVKTSATERRTVVQAEVRSTEEDQRKARVSELG